MYLAKALYDNVAETPDELAFRKGEILTVLEKNTKGLDGWWLCSLKGKHGIAPGNRLKILSGIGESSVGAPVGDGASKVSFFFFFYQCLFRQNMYPICFLLAVCTI